jgi:hypothetical protein
MKRKKLCKNCKHYIYYSYVPDCCAKTAVLHIRESLVIGDDSYQTEDKCIDCRSKDNLCGEDAKWYEPKLWERFINFVKGIK